MKPGDVVMIYLDPAQCTREAGQATLIEKVKNYSSNMEEWMVSYVNRPCTQCKVLIKKEDEEDKT
jgi:hypothetical protein